MASRAVHAQKAVGRLHELEDIFWRRRGGRERVPEGFVPVYSLQVNALLGCGELNEQRRGPAQVAPRDGSSRRELQPDPGTTACSSPSLSDPPPSRVLALRFGEGQLKYLPMPTTLNICSTTTTAVGASSIRLEPPRGASGAPLHGAGARSMCSLFLPR